MALTLSWSGCSPSASTRRPHGRPLNKPWTRTYHEPSRDLHLQSLPKLAPGLKYDPSSDIRISSRHAATIEIPCKVRNSHSNGRQLYRKDFCQCLTPHTAWSPVQWSIQFFLFIRLTHFQLCKMSCLQKRLRTNLWQEEWNTAPTLRLHALWAGSPCRFALSPCPAQQLIIFMHRHFAIGSYACRYAIYCC